MNISNKRFLSYNIGAKIKSLQKSFSVWLHISILIIIVVSFALIYASNLKYAYREEFASQARSFLSGELVVEEWYSHDTVTVNDRRYWPEQPLPSFLFTPFFILGDNIRQYELHWILVAVLTLLVMSLAHRKGFGWLSSAYLTAAFLFGSMVAGIITNPESYYFAQTIALVLLLVSLLEWEGRKRPFVLGVIVALILATRPIAALIVFSFIFIMLRQMKPWKEKTFDLLSLTMPILLSLIGLLWFNWARFGNPFESGYLLANVGSVYSQLQPLGLFSIQHIPMNLYYYFFSGFVPVHGMAFQIIFPYITYCEVGLSIFLVAPFFLYALRTLRLKHKMFPFWIIIGIQTVILLLFMGPGWVQFGPRYMADFFPVIFLMTLYALKPPNLLSRHKLIIIVSVLLNIYLLFSLHFYEYIFGSKLYACNGIYW